MAHIVIAVFSAAVSLSGLTMVAHATPPLRIATLGTSITRSGHWQQDLQNRLELCQGRPVIIFNKALNARTSDWGKRQIENLIGLRPDVITIEFAINDARTDFNVSLSDSKKNTVAIIRALRAALPEVKILLMTTNPVRWPTHRGRPELARYFQMYRNIAAEEEILLVDTAPQWAKRPDYDIPDGIHPTRNAHQEVTVPAIAQAIDARCALTPRHP